VTYPYPLDANGIDAVIQMLATDYPAITRRFELAFPSHDLGRPIYALRVGRREDRHGVLFLGGLHARELVNPDLLLAFAAQLCDAYTRRTEMRFGPVVHPRAIAQLIVESLTLFFVPLVNPDGRIWVQTADAGWRKNRRVNSGSSCRGADVNRNFDFLWAEGIATSTNPCDYQVYRGPSPGSENESKNVRWLLDEFPNIGCLLDVHSYSQYVLYPWGDAPNQTTDPSMSFQNPAWDGMRRDPGYGEYMPPRDQRRHRRTAEAVANAIRAVRGTVYEPTQTYFMDVFGPTYPTSATANDYAYSRHLMGAGSKVLGFAIETGTLFQPTAEVAAEWTTEVSSGLVTFLLRCLCPLDELLEEIFGADWSTAASALREVRDERLLTTAVGTRWVDLFEEHGVEALAIIRGDDELRATVAEALADVARSVIAFREGKRVRIDPGLVRRLDAAAARLAKQGSPSLKAAIKEARVALRNFAGATIPQGLRGARRSS